MTVSRVTQNMTSRHALAGLQAGLGRLADIQEQLSTGRVLNRPSDDPNGTTSAMRLRVSMADQHQFARNAADGMGWLSQVDSTLSSMTSQVRRARELALQGANSGAMGSQAREALATEVDQIREGLIGDANTTYAGRPIFGGITSGDKAFAADGTYVGTAGAVERTVAVGTRLRVDVDGQAAFGVGTGSVFAHLKDLSVALRAGDTTGISQAIDLIAKDGDRITNVQADAGTRAARIERAKAAAEDAELALSSSLSEVENTDLPKATMELKMQEVAYQAALAATARVTQPSLLDFLR